METLNSFFEKYGRRLWHDKYLSDCQFMVNRLSGFSDNHNKPIGAYTDDDIYNFMDHLEDQGLKDNTINRYLAAYSKLFKKAAKKKLIEIVPSVEWKPVGNGRKRYFSAKEIQDLIEFFLDSEHPWMANFVVLGEQTGMRLGEILAINNLKSKKTQGNLSDCGSFVELTETKNGEQRTVPLTDEAQEALARLDNCPADYHSHRTFYDTWDLARECIAPGDEDFVFHVLRHTCATRLAMEFGVDTLVVGSILGHKSIATTKKYVQKDRQAMQAVVNKLKRRAA